MRTNEIVSKRDRNCGTIFLAVMALISLFSIGCSGVVSGSSANSPAPTPGPTPTPTPGPQSLAVTGSILATATIGTAYSSTDHASGGTLPYTWSVSAGSLPPGLSLNATTGNISGTPTTNGAYTFTLKIVDSSSSQNPPAPPIPSRSSPTY